MSRRTIASIVPKGWQLALAWMLLVTYVVTSLAGLPTAFAAPELLGFRSEDVGPQLTREQQFTKSLKALESRDWQEAEKYIVLVGETIEKYAAQIDRATGILTKSH